MNLSTLMHTQSFFPSRSHESGLKLAAISPISSFNSGGMANKVSLKSPYSDLALQGRDRTKKENQESTAVAVHRSVSARQGVMMHFTIDASCVTQLRHLVMWTCGELVTFMRIQPMAHATKMKVSICLSEPAVDLKDAIMRGIPNAEFDHVTPASSMSEAGV